MSNMSRNCGWFICIAHMANLRIFDLYHDDPNQHCPGNFQFSQIKNICLYFRSAKSTTFKTDFLVTTYACRKNKTLM